MAPKMAPNVEGGCPESPEHAPGYGLSHRQQRRQAGKRVYTRHGFTTLRDAVRTLGGRVIDKRTSLGKALAQSQAELVADLGGDPSTAQLALIELAARSKLLLDSIDAWLLTQESLINKRRRSLLPVVRERQQVADGLAKYLQALGLERRAKPLPSLQEYLAQRAAAVSPPAP